MERPITPDRLTTTVVAAGAVLGALAVYRLSSALHHEKDKDNTSISLSVDASSVEQVANSLPGTSTESSAPMTAAKYPRQPRYEDELATVAQTVFS